MDLTERACPHGGARLRQFGGQFNEASRLQLRIVDQAVPTPSGLRRPCQTLKVGLFVVPDPLLRAG
jgi:hypothetical protein